MTYPRRETNPGRGTTPSGQNATVGTHCQIPSLATIRPKLTPRVAAWVEARLAGETNDQFARRIGVALGTVNFYAKVFAEIAGLELRAGPHIHIELLLMRIRELEESVEACP